MVGPPLPDILPFGSWQLFSFFLPLLPFFSISTVILFLRFPFLYYLPISSPFSAFPPHFLCFLFCPSCTTQDISFPVSPYLSLVPLLPPPNFRKKLPLHCVITWNSTVLRVQDRSVKSQTLKILNTYCFPWQQWLCENTSVLCQTYTAHLVW